MSFFSWTRWFRSLLRPQVKPIRNERSRLSVELLESRLAPATFFWTGNGANANWSTPANWQTNSAPTGVASNLEDLVFQSGAAQFLTKNDIGNATFNSINISASGYTLAGTGAGNTITLGGLTAITVGSGAKNEVISLNLLLGRGAGAQQSVTVNANGADLTISGSVSATSGVGLTKLGTGLLTLSADNSGFTGPISVSAGVLRASNASALGDTSQGTTVAQNAQLQLSSGLTGLTFNENLLLNGPGAANDGALLNVAGNNTWAGTIELDSNTTFGASATTSIDVTGAISDNGAGHNVTKEGTGTVIFAAADSYRGTTTVNNGVLQIQNPLALGIGHGQSADGVTVNSTITKQGTLQLNDPSGVGFTVINKLLTLNGFGFPDPTLGSLGAVDNQGGNNTWTGNVNLGSPAPNNSDVIMRADTVTVGTTTTVYALTLSGIVQDPNTINNLYKTGQGTVIFTSANTYRGTTEIVEGTLEITDSKGLGSTGVNSGTSVLTGASLELAVDNLPDSVTGTTNTLNVSEPLNIDGGGANGAGALYSASGINIYSGDINLQFPSPTFGPFFFPVSPSAAIGVDADPNPTNSNAYFTDDYSLTVAGQIIGGSNFVVGSPTTPLLQKVGAGQLILPNANNQFTGPTEIQQGWVTIEDSNSLGAVIPLVNQNLQPTITVDDGGALHLKAIAATGINLPQNLSLAGTGFTHPFSQINKQGAVENVAGVNTLDGNINLVGAAGLGVEKVFGASQLTEIGTMSDTPPNLALGRTASGGSAEDDNIIQTGSTSGTLTVSYDMYVVPDRMDIYYGVKGQGGVHIFGTGPGNPNPGQQVAGQRTFSVNFGPGTFTKVEIIMNQGGGNNGTAWTYTATLTPTSVSTANLVKLGSQLLILQGDGTYKGDVQIKQGVLLNQNNTGLGIGGATTTVESGAALVLANGTPYNNGGVRSGVQVRDEKLILNGPGNNTLGSPIAPLTVWSNANLTTSNVFLQNLGSDIIAPTDVTWRGPITLNTSVPIDVQNASRLNLDGIVSDASNAAAGGSDLIKVDTGELVLSDPNTYRGTTYLGTGATDVDGVNQFFSGNPATAQGGGVVTVANGQGLGSAASGTVVQFGSSLQLEGNITIAGESLMLQGSGISAADLGAGLGQSWFQQGPSPIVGAQTPGQQKVSGRMTGIAVDPLDSSTIYVTTAGGGAWKTINGGKTWLQLFDNTAAMFSGAIAIGNDAENGNAGAGDANTIYLGTGEADNSGDSYYGTGVYASHDAGHTWTLLTSQTGTANPLFGQAISKIVVDPNNSNIIYVASSDNPVNSLATSPPGVWRYDGTNWFNLTGTVSALRSAAGGPNTPGPDDDFRLRFPNTGVYSDLGLSSTGVLFMSLGSSDQVDFVNRLVANQNNAVYRCINPATANSAPGNQPIWDVGGGGANTPGNNPYPTNIGAAAPATKLRNGNIKLTVEGNTIYAVNSTPYNFFGQSVLLDVQKSVDGGLNWKATAAAPPNFVSTQGYYDLTIISPDGNTVYVGGADNGNGRFVFTSPDGGATWSPISIDANGNGPHSDEHAMALDSTGQLYLGGDGGIFQLQTSNGNTWNDINGNLATITFVGIAVSPNNPDLIFAASQDNGTERFTGSQAWDWVEPGDGGIVQIDPHNADIIYHVLNGFLRKSTTGGGVGSWVTLPFGQFVNGLYFPLVIDQVNSDRLLAGGFSLQESMDQGANFTDLQPPISVSSVAAATYQGKFVADPAFTQVFDQGSNNYDPDTIYVTDGSRISVTKNHGVTWTPTFGAGSRNLPVGTSIGDLEVDPTNRDIVYAVTNGFGGGHVFRSTNAGQNWVSISSNLPDVPTWKLVIDPRTGNLYIGNDLGVYVSANNGVSWATLGTGLPKAQAQNLALDQSANTLTVGTYGRSAFQILLNGTLANAGGLSVVSGSAVWTGPITLAGPTTIGADGTQSLLDGIATAQLNIVGSIGDLSPTGANTLTKVGQGNVILSGSNTYGGVTDIQVGVLVAANPDALGATTNPTIVEPGTALKLESSINGEPLTLYGDGPVSFNGHNTGGLENISQNNTYSGPITLAGIGGAMGVTIGVDSGTTLTITGAISGPGFSLTKELTGTLILNDANTYSGKTFVNQGILIIESAGALANSAATVVIDGAQIQLQAPTGGSGFTENEALSLSGTGIDNTGALLNVAGNNTWSGPITLDANPGFSTLTYPVGVVSIGVLNSMDVLTISGAIGDETNSADANLKGLSAGLQIGSTSGVTVNGTTVFETGTVVLSNANTYVGTTYVQSGRLTIQNAKGLGATNANEIQRVTIFDPSVSPAPPGTFTLTFTFNGQTGTTNALASNASASQVQTQLNNLFVNLGINGTVIVTLSKVSAPLAPLPASFTEFIFTIAFQGVAFASVDLPQLVATALGSATATVSTVADGGTGAIVSNGAALDLDLATSPNGQIVTGEPLHLNGTGINGTGALDNVSGSNTLTAQVNLDTSASYNGAAIGVDGGQLTVSGDVAGVAAATLTKVGTGTLLFPNANDYKGTTLIQNGILNIGNAGALGASTSNEVQAVTVTGATSGTFRLTLGTQQTGPIAANATANQVAMALATLPTVGTVANVNVTLSGSVYTITFIGALAGQDLPQMTASATLGTLATVATLQDGGAGDTIVNSAGGVSGTLQLQGGITESTEKLFLNGPGYNNRGALDSLSGANTWAIPIVLQSSSSIGVDADAGATPGLTINQVVSGPAAGTNLTVVGLGAGGTLQLTATNTYNGATFVNNATLLLADNGGLAIPGDLTVGDGIGAASTAKARLAFNGELDNTANVTVNSDGLFDLNGKTQTLNELIIVDGTAQTGANGMLNLASNTTALSMTGGNLNIGASGQVILGGGVTATSNTPVATPVIATVTGPGTLSLGGHALTFTVNAGTGASDLDVQVSIVPGSGTPGLTKAGAGRLELDAVSAYGLTTVTGGDVQVDGKIGDVLLNGGGVSGTGADANHGQVASIGGPAGGAPNGAISPGNNGALNPIGTLTTTPGSGFETWGSATTFAVDLNDTSGPGVGNDLLKVTGALNLGAATQIAGGGAVNGGATLTGTANQNIAVGQSFTIIQSTGNITGFFAEPFANNTVFLSGLKFGVTYNLHSVVLTRQINNSTISIVPSLSSPNPTVYGQDVTFTAMLSGEPGATAPFQANDQLKFTLHPPTGPDVIDVVTIAANGQASFDASSTGRLAPGTYLLNVSFAGDPNYAPAALVPTYQQVVNQDPTTITLAPSAPNPVYGQPLSINATILPKAPGSGIPTGTVDFTIDGGAPMSANVDPNTGIASLPVSLAVGSHTIKATYNGDGNFFASSTVNPQLVVVIGKDFDTMQLIPNPGSPSYIGQTVTFTATVSTNGPGTAVPTGTVNFFDGMTPIGSGMLMPDNMGNYLVQLSTSTLMLGVHSITAQYLGSSLERANQVTINYTVAQIGTTTTLTSSTGVNPAAFGQSVTFTATVTSNVAGTGTPTGTVTFRDGGVQIGNPVALNSNGVATFTTNTLSATTHTITATYSGATRFASSVGTLTQQVQYSSATTVISSVNPSTVGQSVTFTATVRPGVGQPAGTPTGTVNFFIDNAIVAGPLTLNGSGQQSFTTSSLNAGPHSVVVQYSGSATYGASNSNVLNQSVLNSSSIVLSPSGQNPAPYGTPLTFTATVTSSGTPTGTVSFFDGTTSLGTQPLSGGTATLNIANLRVGNHNLTAKYSGDPATMASTSLTVSQTITRTATTTSVMTSGSPSASGQVVTFTATVSAPGSSLFPTGTVSFVFNGNTANPHPITASSNGVFVYSTNLLPPGNYNLVATYSDAAGNFGPSSGSVGQVVLAGTTTTLRDSPSNPVLFNQAVTLGGTVNRPANTTAPFGGTLHFVDTTTNADFGTFAVDPSTGKAQAPAGTFTTGTHHLTATYSGDSAYAGSVGILDLVVQSTTTVSLDDSGNSNPSVFSETLNYKATVSSDDGFTQPTGSVNFLYQGGVLATVPLTGLTPNSSTASVSFSNLVSGRSAYLISAQYNGTASLRAATSPAISQTINVDPTTTTVMSSAPTSGYGQNVTWTATVMKTGAATQTPNGGTVTFQIGNGGLHVVPLMANGTASFSANNVAVGLYTVTATYSGLTQKFGGSVGTVGQQVSAASTSTTVTSNANPSGVGQTVTFTASVQNVSGSIVPTGGTVTFTIDSVDQAAVSMTNGIATFATGTLGFGNHTILARYNGAQNFNPSPPSSVLTQAVNNPSQTTLVSSRNPSTAGDSVTFTATVTHSAGAQAPTGSVNFYDGSALLATQPLNGNTAMFTTSGLGIGTHTIVAKYLGDNNYAVSRGVVTQQVYAPVASITANLTTPPANNDGVNNPFRIDGYARDANGNTTVPPAPATATLMVVSGPGTFKSGGNTTATFSAGSWAFQNLELTVGGVYTLRITYGNFSADITIDTGRLT